MTYNRQFNYRQFDTRTVCDLSYNYTFVIDRDTGSKYCTLVTDRKTGDKKHITWFDASKPYKRQLQYYLRRVMSGFPQARVSRATYMGNKNAVRFTVRTAKDDPEFPCQYKGSYTREQIDEMLKKYPYRHLRAYGQANKKTDEVFRHHEDIGDLNGLIVDGRQLVRFVSDDEMYMYVPMDRNYGSLFRGYYEWLTEHSQKRAHALRKTFKYHTKRGSLRYCYMDGECRGISYKEDKI